MVLVSTNLVIKEKQFKKYFFLMFTYAHKIGVTSQVFFRINKLFHALMRKHLGAQYLVRY